ncbi:MAG TPA: hypothetical protein VEI97_04435, partial [bacterium]|nr:hypothetical protein [bacterium]
DHAATVIAPTAWPDSSDLSKIPEDSSPDAAEASVPALDSDGVFAGTLVPSGPTAVTVDVSVALDNRDAFDVPSGTAVVPGLLRVTDAQDNDDTAADGVINQVLSEESTIPLPGMHPLVPTVRYQAFAVTVEDATACTPTTFAFQTQEVAVNADPAQNFRTVSWDSFDLKKIAAADQTGDVYLFYRWSSSPNTWFVSRTANGGDSWGVPAAIPSSLLGGTYTTGTTLTMGASVLLTGPTSGQPIVIANANLTAPNPVFFLKGVDGAGGTTTWSGNDGSTITPSGTYRVATITGDPTDLTGQRAYALVRQTGAGVNQLHLFRTINAQAMVPTWTNLGPVDDNGGSGSEDEPVMVIDLSGNLHVVYRHAPIIGTNDVWYRKISTPGTTPSLGPVVMVSNSGTENVNNLQLFADATGRALVVWEQWDNNDSSFGDIFIARGDAAGTSFTTPLQVDPAGTDQSYPDVIVDTTGRVVVAWNDGTLTARSVFLAAYSADLSCQLVPPTRAHTDVPSSTVDFPRLALDIVRNRLLVIYRRNGFGGPLPSPDSGYQLRSRWFTIM